MALRIRPHEDPKLVEHYVYNLEHTGTSVVRIWQAIHGPDDPDDNDLVITIDPGKYVVITETGPWPPVPQDVNWDDPLIRHMQKVARLAETKAKACKSN